jgi:hypothetical protein
MTPEEKAAYLENDDGIEAAHGVRRVASRRFASRRYPVPRDSVVVFFSFS